MNDERGNREPCMARPRGTGGVDILTDFEKYVKTTSSGTIVSTLPNELVVFEIVQL